MIQDALHHVVGEKKSRTLARLITRLFLFELSNLISLARFHHEVGDLHREPFGVVAVDRHDGKDVRFDLHAAFGDACPDPHRNDLPVDGRVPHLRRGFELHFHNASFASIAATSWSYADCRN